MKMYRTLISQQTYSKAQDYQYRIQSGGKPGRYLENRLRAADLAYLSTDSFIELLMRTRTPKIFSEGDIHGDGSDWNETELSILGDISIATPVTVFDNGRYSHPSIHQFPFSACLLFVSGALLQSDRMSITPDWKEVAPHGEIDREAFNRLYARRLLPPLRYANNFAMARRRRAFITIPSLIGKHQSGSFEKQVSRLLQDAIVHTLNAFSERLPCVRAVYFDPYDQCENERLQIGGIQLMVRPREKGNADKSQLCHPVLYEEAGDDFGNCLLFSVVNWDPVSWPGSDYYAGHRETDDGVKAAATDSMAILTRTRGAYDPEIHRYQPPIGFRDWKDVILRKGVKLMANDYLDIFN